MMPDTDQNGHADGGKLPAVRDDGEVLEGVVVGEPPPSATARAVRVALVIARHEHTKRAGRHLGYIPLGALVVAKRLWDSRTTARYERWLRRAEAAGDQQSALEWEKRMADFRKDRHQRRVDMVRVPTAVVMMLPKFIFGLVMVLAFIGCLLAGAERNIAEVAVPFTTAARVVEIVVIVFSIAWGPLLLAAPWVAVGALWWAGRGYARAAGWTTAAKNGDEDGGIIVTADTIVLALQHLRIPELKKAAKDGWKPSFHTLPVRDGRGYSAVFSLPLGVTAGMIADQRAVLARNVHRAEVEVWPSDAEKAGAGPAGTVAVWIADSGVLSKAAPEYPLMHEGTADVFRGVPGGISPRGDGLDIPIVGNNFVVGGQMGQGKSNACRVVMLGCALDPLCELDVFVFANNGDFDAYRLRLARYFKGTEDDVVAAAVDRLHELYAEVARREQRLADLGAKKLTRGLAEQHADLRPVVALFSECHELFGHKEHGEMASELSVKTAKRARKTGITLLFDTQSSRAAAIPPALVELVSVNACFYVKTWRSNDGFLGDGSFAAGIRATELRPGRDRGTSLITGVSEAQFELLRWYFVEVNDDTGFDAAADPIARAVARMAPGAASGSVRQAVRSRDLLADLGTVLNHERIKLRDAAGLLRTAVPAWGPYQKLTAVQLRDALNAEGVKTVNSSGTPYLDPADLRAVLDRRAGSDDE